MKLSALFLAICTFQTYGNSYSQNTKISVKMEDVSVETVLDEIEAMTDFKFFIDTKQVDVKRRVSIKEKKKNIFKILKVLFSGTGVVYEVVDKQIILKKQPTKAAKPVQMAMIQEKGTVTGNISDIDGPLAGATVLIVGTTIGAVTDFDGNYTLEANPGELTIEASYTGYQPVKKTVTVAVGQEVTLDFVLSGGMMLDDVVLTGSRKRARSVISSPMPIDNFAGTTIDQQGNGDITESFKNVVPSFNATPLTGDGSAFVRPTSLRGLPPDETLILMNSKRRHRSALIAHLGAAMNVGAHASDIGMIPSLALKNVEVLRDGAAAQYGSDAIAGVFNFILKDDSEGMELQTQVGKWYGKNYGKNETDYKVAMNAGFPLTENGFINLTGEYTYNQELSRCLQHADAVGVEGAQEPAMNWGRPESKGLRTIWNAGITLNDDMALYSFGNFASTYGNLSFFYRAPDKSGVLTPFPNNPNDPSEGNFCWCDQFPAGFTPRFEGFQTDYSAIVGLDGVLGGSGVNYDVSASFGSNRIDYVLNNTISASWGPYSQTVFRPGDLQQSERNFNVDLSRELATNLNLAAGMQTRRETYTMYVGDEQSWVPGPWSGVSALINPETGENYAEPLIGSDGYTGTSRETAGDFIGKSWGAYTDIEWDITEPWLLQLAYRHEDYELFGTADNFKAATRYRFSDWLTFRGGYSTGFRAPTPGQANVEVITSSFDAVSNEQVLEGTIKPTDPLAVQYGGKALTPETSSNISAGLASRIGNALTLTLDYYNIRVDDRIFKTRSIPVEGNDQFSEIAFYTNALQTETTGFDAVLTYKKGGTDVSLAYNFNETRVLDQNLVNGVEPVPENTVFNLENNLPKHRGTFNFNQKFGKLATTLRANYYGKTIDERDLREEVGDETLVDLELSYPMSEMVTVVLGGNNIFDNYPDEIDTRISQGMPYPRRTPIGYLGGMVYFRMIYRL